MARKRVQVGFRVDGGFFEHMQAESVKREMTVQDMIITALKLYFQTPMPGAWDYSLQTFVKFDKDVSKEDVLERKTWLDLCWKYITQMPPEKVEMLLSAVKWDLQTQKSSRRKGAPKKGAARLAGN